MVAVGCALLLPLNGDVRFQAGTEQTSPLPVAETFTHRPLAYRLIMTVVFAPARLLGESSPAFELAMQVEALLLCALIGLLLHRALRSRGLPGLITRPVAIAVAASCGLQGTISLWEPDWVALVLTVLAVAAGLSGRNDHRARLPAIACAGMLMAAAASIKIVTLPIALIGLVVIALLDRRRAVAATAVAAGAGVIWIGLTAWLWPRELRWLAELSTLQPPDTEPVWRSALGLGGALLVWPVTIMLPAALSVLLAGRSRRAGLALGSVAALVLLLACLPAVVQHQFFVYHFVALPVITAACLVLAVIRARPETATRLVIGTVLAGLASAVIIRLPAPWRTDHLAAFVAGLVVAMIIAVLVVRHGDRLVPGDHLAPEPDTRRGSVALAAAAACCATMIGIVAPGPTGTAPLTEVPQTGLINVNAPEVTERHRDNAREIRRAIGVDTPVLYLAFGDVNYFVRNPTPCRYPASVWLQRARYNPAVMDTVSYAENLACLDDPAPRFLLLDGNWFRLNRQPEPLRRAIERVYDCTGARNLDGLLICPRR